MTPEPRGARRWRADRESVLRTRAILLSLVAYLLLVVLLMPFHPPDELRYPVRGLWPDDLAISVPVALGALGVLVVALRALRLVTAITLYADGSILLAAPLRSVVADAAGLRELRRVRWIADELVTADRTVRLAGGMLCPELIEALCAENPRLDVTASIAWRHPTRPRPVDAPAAPVARPSRRPGASGAARGAPVRRTLARRRSTRSGSGWGPPVAQGVHRPGGIRSGHWRVPQWWVPGFVVLLALIGAYCVAMPVGLILAVPLGGGLVTFVLFTLGALWGLYPYIVLRWAFIATSVELDVNGTLVVTAPATTRSMPVSDVWQVRLLIHVDRNRRIRPPLFALETATGVLRLPNRLVDHDLLDALANANPLMLVPSREP